MAGRTTNDETEDRDVCAKVTKIPKNLHHSHLRRVTGRFPRWHRGSEKSQARHRVLFTLPHGVPSQEHTGWDVHTVDISPNTERTTLPDCCSASDFSTRWRHPTQYSNQHGLQNKRGTPDLRRASHRVRRRSSKGAIPQVPAWQEHRKPLARQSARAAQDKPWRQRQNGKLLYQEES